MSQNEFYVFLPSDANEVFESNTLSSYKTKLLKPLELSGEWEVALAEIVYTRSWFNFPQEDMMRLIFFEKADDNSYKQAGYTTNINGYIEEGQYIPIEITNKLQATLDEFGKNNPKVTPPKVIYDKNKNKIKIRVGTDSDYPQLRIVPKFGPELQGALGIDKYQTYLDHIVTTGKYWADREIDLDGGRRTIFVYTDIVQPVIIGNKVAPVIRVVPVNQKSVLGSHVSHTFTSPFYFPLSRNFITSIDITLRDITGARIPFRSGRVVCTLHFRRRPQ